MKWLLFFSLAIATLPSYAQRHYRGLDRLEVTAMVPDSVRGFAVAYSHFLSNAWWLRFSANYTDGQHRRTIVGDSIISILGYATVDYAAEAMINRTVFNIGQGIFFNLGAGGFLNYRRFSESPVVFGSYATEINEDLPPVDLVSAASTVDSPPTPDLVTPDLILADPSLTKRPSEELFPGVRATATLEIYLGDNVTLIGRAERSFLVRNSDYYNRFFYQAGIGINF